MESHRTLPLERFPFPPAALFAAALGALLAFPEAPAAAERPGRDPFETAGALLEAQRFSEARDLALRALRAGASGKEALAWRCLVAESYQLEGDFEEAEKAYAALAGSARGPLGVEVALRLAKCRLQMWDPRGAVEVLDRIPAEDLGDRRPEREELRAIALFVSGKAAEAQKILRGIERKSDSGWHYLGLIAFNVGDYAAAAEHFERALAEAPGDYYNRLYRAQSLLELGRLEEARAAFRRILGAVETPEAHQLLGKVELRAERFAEAEKHFRRAIEMSPKNAEAHFGLATALRRLKKTDEAKGAAAKFQELHIEQQKALDVAYKLHQEHEANPGDAGVAEELARHYLATDDPAAAERMAWHAVRADPARTEGRLALARTYARVGQYREAALHYRRILKDRPGHPEAERELGELIRRHARRVDGDR